MREKGFGVNVEVLTERFTSGLRVLPNRRFDLHRFGILWFGCRLVRYLWWHMAITSPNPIPNLPSPLGLTLRTSVGHLYLFVCLPTVNIIVMRYLSW